jgi:hypothetical protein
MLAKDTISADRAVAVKSELSIFGPELHLVVIASSDPSGNCTILFLEADHVIVLKVVQPAIEGSLPGKLL